MTSSEKDNDFDNVAAYILIKEDGSILREKWPEHGGMAVLYLTEAAAISRAKYEGSGWKVFRVYMTYGFEVWPVREAPV